MVLASKRKEMSTISRCDATQWRSRWWTGVGVGGSGMTAWWVNLGNLGKWSCKLRKYSFKERDGNSIESRGGSQQMAISVRP